MSSSAEIEALKQELIREPKNRQARFRLGAALHSQGDYQGAITHLQQCRADPALRIPALQLMIDALKARKLFDLADRLASELGDGGALGGVISSTGPRPTPPLIARAETDTRKP